MIVSRDDDRPIGRATTQHDDQPGRAQSSAFTSVELTRRTDAMAPRIAALAPEAERLRRPTDEAWRMLRASGYFHQFVPRHFGGMATDINSFIDATLPIAEACASTAWTAAFCAGHNRSVANFPIETQTELWDTSDAADWPRRAATMSRCATSSFLSTEYCATSEWSREKGMPVACMSAPSPKHRR